MNLSTLTKKYQTTVPKEVREELGLAVGESISWVRDKKGGYKVEVARSDILSLKGLVKKPSKPVSINDMKRAVEQSASE